MTHILVFKYYHHPTSSCGRGDEGLRWTCKNPKLIHISSTATYSPCQNLTSHSYHLGALGSNLGVLECWLSTYVFRQWHRSTQAHGLVQVKAAQQVPSRRAAQPLPQPSHLRQRSSSLCQLQTLLSCPRNMKLISYLVFYPMQSCKAQDMHPLLYKQGYMAINCDHFLGWNANSEDSLKQCFSKCQKLVCIISALIHLEQNVSFENMTLFIEKES